MTGGQLLVFWCCVLGLVVIVLAELHRWTHRNDGLRVTPNRRLREELSRHDSD